MLVLINGFFYVIKIIISYFLSIIIHEIGHAIFVKIFRGKVKGIGIGMLGDPIYNIGKFYIKKDFLYGSVQWEMPLNVKDYQLILVYFAGPLFNLITAVALWRFGNPEYEHFYDGLMLISQNLAVINLIPFTFFNSTKSDGRNILDIVQNRKQDLN